MHCILDLQLTLIDHNSQPTQKVPLTVNIRRNITLVPEYSYEVNCNHNLMGGFTRYLDSFQWHTSNSTSSRAAVKHYSDKCLCYGGGHKQLEVGLSILSRIR